MGTALCLTAQKLSLAPLHRVCPHILFCAQVLAGEPKVRRLQRCSRARDRIVGSGDSSICVHIGLARHAIIWKQNWYLPVGRSRANGHYCSALHGSPQVTFASL